MKILNIITEEMEIKPTMKYYSGSARLAKIKRIIPAQTPNLKITKCPSTVKWIIKLQYIS